MSATDELIWFKSSYSGSQGDSCVEVATRPGTVHVRDSKDTAGPHLTLPSHVWAAFVTHTTAGVGDVRGS